MKVVWRRTLKTGLAVMLAAGMMFGTLMAARGEENSSVAAMDAVEAVNVSDTGYDVVFCIDNSRSMWKQQDIRDQAVRVLANLAVGSDIRIGGVYFADHVYQRCSLTSLTGEEDTKKVMSFLNFTDKDDGNRDTNIGSALSEALKFFENQDISRKRIIVLFSDGINEDYEGTGSYTARANNMTIQAVGEINEAQIALYCVFLEKDRADEAYLRNLVNYFKEDGQYDQERFFPVAENEIDRLADKFSDVFYAMQNNMKYENITMDKDGIYSFYVPSMGVDKVQISLKGIESLSAEPEITAGEDTAGKEAAGEGNEQGKSSGNGQIDTWMDGETGYITIQNPSVGKWTVKAEAKDPSEVKGTLAFYAHLKAVCRLASVDGSGIYKNSLVTVKADFCDGAGRAVDIDPAADVTCYLEFASGKKEKMVLTKTGMGCGSGQFLVPDYGTYDFKVDARYEGFVNLEFWVPGGEIRGRGPRAAKIPPVFFSHTVIQDDKKQQSFMVLEEDLFTDPDGESVKIEKVVQSDAGNPVYAVQKDGVVVFTAKKTGALEIGLQLVDESGMTAVINVKGYVVNKARMITVLVVFAVVLAAVAAMITSSKKSDTRKRKFIKNSAESIRQLRKEIQEMHHTYDELMPQIDLDGINLDQVLLCRLSERLADVQIERWGIKQYITQDGIQPANTAENLVQALDTCFSKAGSTDTWDGKTDGLSRKQLNETYGKAMETRKALLDLKSDIRKYLEEMKKLPDSLEALQAEMDEKIDYIRKTLEQTFKCSLTLECGEELIGAKGARGLKGFYCLDDVRVSGMKQIDTLGEALAGGTTGIIVYPLGEDGRDGLRFEGNDKFKIRDEGQEDFTYTDSANLLKGKVYRLYIRKLGEVIVSIS